MKLTRARRGIDFARIAGAIFCGLAAAANLNLALAEIMFRWGHPLSRFSLAENAEVFEWRAEREPENARAWWLEAVRLNPRASPVWIALGLEAERRGDFNQAERDLLNAARVDRQYMPAWTLANFYFRRANDAGFSKWARRAAGLAYDDLVPLVELCDRMDASSTLARLGDSPTVERAYLDLLIRERRWTDAQTIARKMGARREVADRARLLAYTTLQIGAGNGEPARETWGELFWGGSLLTNGDLRAEPSGQGFDWKILMTEGIESQWRASRIRFWFSGRERDVGPLLEQPVLLEAGRYRLQFEYAASSASTGLRWAIDSKVFAGAESRPLQGTLRAEKEWTFGVPRAGLARLVFLYRRELGAVPAEGSAEIRNIRLERSR